MIVNDGICEDDETLFVQLSTPAGETQVILSPQNGTATIIDDDGNPKSYLYIKVIPHSIIHGCTMIRWYFTVVNKLF